MNRNNIKSVTTVVVLVFSLTILGSIITISSVVHAQIPLVPGITTNSPTKANLTPSVTMPTKSSHASTISRLKGVNFTNATGDIASLQNNQITKPHGTWFEQFAKGGIWLLSGKWTLGLPSATTQTKNVTTPTFDASFNMVMLNGTATHKHKISDFLMLGNPIINSTEHSTTLRGTVTVTMKDGPHTNVPISIKLIGKSVLSLGIDLTKTNGHFGATPIFGTVTGLG